MTEEARKVAEAAAAGGAEVEGRAFCFLPLPVRTGLPGVGLGTLSLLPGQATRYLTVCS